MRAIGPDVVAVTSRWEVHPDHAAAARATVSALARLAPLDRPALWEFPVWLWADWPLSRRVGPAAGARQLLGLVVRGRVRRLDVAAGSRKPAALAHYGSQLGARTGDPTLPPTVLRAALSGPELFFVDRSPGRD